jgi:hypothetical protein
MLRATVMLVGALALAACAGLDIGLPREPAAEPAPDAAVASPAAPAAPPPTETTAARPAPATGEPATAAPPPVVTLPAEPVRSALAPPSPAVPSPAVPAPRPAGAACAELAAGGPIREIDLDMVRRLLRGGDYRRGSFESNGSYRARVVAKLEAVEALAVERTGRHDLVFSLPIPAYRLTYDADAHVLSIGSELGLLRGGSAIGMGDFILVSSSERQIGSHLATIAYGARGGPGVQQEVAKITGDQLGIILPGGSSMGWPANYARLHVPMTANEAAAAKQAFAVLFVGRLQEPYFITGEFIQEPKLGDPVDKHLTVEALKIAVDCAAVYDRTSGRLIRQILPPAG